MYVRPMPVSVTSGTKPVLQSQNQPTTAGINSSSAIIPTNSPTRVAQTSHNFNQDYIKVGGVSVQHGIVDSVTSPVIASVNPATSVLQGVTDLKLTTMVGGNPVPGNQS